MKKTTLILFCLFALLGCTKSDDALARAMELRTSLLQAEGCAFHAQITADFGDSTYVFETDCTADAAGTIRFCVTAPESIAQIGGTIDAEGGKLTFDDHALAFPLQGDGALSPVSAPWIFLRALRGGYVRYCVREGAHLRLTADDSYDDNALMLDIWLDADNVPVQADIYEENRKILTLVVSQFRIL